MLVGAATRALGKINRLHKRAAQRREKLPGEFIEAEYTNDGAESDHVVEDGRVPGDSILRGRRRLFLAERQAIVLLGTRPL